MSTSVSAQLQMTASDRALLAGVGDADLASKGPLQIKLLQNNSPELTAGTAEYLGDHARAGMFAVPHEGEWILTKSDQGYDFQLVAFTRAFLEWLAGRGGFVAPHSEKPGDAVWLDKGGRHPTWDHEDVGAEKAGFWRANGNKVEETILAHKLVGNIGLKAPIAGVFGFRSTALAVGRDLGDRAQRLKVEGENIKGIILGKWKMTSRLEVRNDYRWWLPVATLIGKFGEKTGPTLAEVRLAASLRQAFKEGLPWAPEPPEPPAPPSEHIAPARIAPAPAPAAASAQRRGSIEVNGQPVNRGAYAQDEDASYGGPRSRDEVDLGDYEF
jgi:hypothetical protein